MELIPHDLKIDFMGKAWVACFLSLASIVWAFYLWFHQGDAKWGVDFRGGYDLIVNAPGSNTDSIRAVLDGNGFPGAVVQAFKSDADKDQFVVRFGAENVQPAPAPGAKTDSSSVPKQVEGILKQGLNSDVHLIKSDFVGPAVGAELRRSGLIAVVLSLIAMLIYVSIRFEFAFGLGAVGTLFHDAVTTMGFYLFAGYAINMITLAAALTTIGYSMHDNIIIFDRIREEASRRKSFNLITLMNESINVTMSRTLITTSLTFVSCLALYFFGGASLEDFSFFLVIGMIVGTYSSVYVACPIAFMWHRLRGGTVEIQN